MHSLCDIGKELLDLWVKVSVLVSRCLVSEDQMFWLVMIDYVMRWDWNRGRGNGSSASTARVILVERRHGWRFCCFIVHTLSTLPSAGVMVATIVISGILFSWFGAELCRGTGVCLLFGVGELWLFSCNSMTREEAHIPYRCLPIVAYQPCICR